MCWFFTCFLAALALPSVHGGVLEGFGNPPVDARPETWLQISSGNAGKAGMTLDLEAIAEAGFSGVQLFHESFRDLEPWPGVKEQIPCMSPGWEDFIAHTARECRRLGLRFVMHNCPGWSMAGGPWVPADKAMRELVLSRTEAMPGQRIRVSKPQKAADAAWRDYRDIAVVAFPTPVGYSMNPLMPVDVNGTRTYDARMVKAYRPDQDFPEEGDDAATSRSNWWNAVAGAGDRPFSFPGNGGTAEVVVDFGDSVTVRTIALSPVQRFNHSWSFQPDVAVRVSAEGPDGAWRLVSDRKMPQSTWQDEKPISLALPETTARRFRVVFAHRHPMTLSSVKFYSGARPDNWEAESAGVLRALMDGGDAATARAAYVDPARIVSLTDRLRHDDTLDWSPPPGKWTVLRVGHVNAGIKNHPAPPEATGWECDKLSAAGADAHWNGYLGRLSAPGGALSGGILGGLLMDSWECEAQTWTLGLDAVFFQKWGYSLDGWWPALAGFVVGSRRATSLFYRDWRELLGDLVFDNFYGHLSDRARSAGLFVTFETCGCDVLPADPMKHWRHADEPMCEFWRPRSKEGGIGSLDYKPVRPCVSAARIYGKRRVSAEALCCTAKDWRTEHLRDWKADLDYYLSQGVTHFVFENFTHDPRTDGLPPGTGYAAIMGTLLCRRQTWWRHMRDFTDYLARAQRLLETGVSVSDVLLYLGDRIDHKPPQNLPFPAGLAYDYLNRDAYLSRIAVRDGKWVSPEGLSWDAIWLYDERDLRPETKAKLESDERAGGRVIRGDIFAGAKSFGLRPSVIAPKNLSWQHRRTNCEEIYFFAEEDGRPFDETVRVWGTGEAWLADPVSGAVSHPDEVSFDDGYANVRLRLGAARARFLVIRRGPPKARKVVHRETVLADLSQGWTIVFPPGWGFSSPVRIDNLTSWTDLDVPDEAKAYSGSATYRKTFYAKPSAHRMVLDLGRVEVAATVRINGRLVGNAWTTPYAFDVSEYVREGENILEVDVVNGWHNRLLYDSRLPAERRKTWTLGYPDPKGSLLPSGLIGPVRLVELDDESIADFRP